MMKIQEMLDKMRERKNGIWYKVAESVEKAKCKKCGREGLGFVLLKFDLGEYDNYLGATILCGPCVAAMRNVYDRDLLGSKFWDYCNSNGGIILCLHCGYSDTITLKIMSKVDREVLYKWFENKEKYHQCEDYQP